MSNVNANAICASPTDAYIAWIGDLCDDDARIVFRAIVCRLSQNAYDPLIPSVEIIDDNTRSIGVFDDRERVQAVA